MKIVCLGNYFSTGGAQLDCIYLCSLLKGMGYSAESWFFIKEGTLDTGEVKFRIFSEKKPTNPLTLLKMIRNYQEALYEFRPDIILGFYPFSNIMGALAYGNGFCGKFIASQRSLSYKQSRLFGIIEKYIGSTYLYHTNICVSQGVLDTFQNYPKSYRRKLRVVYNGLPPLTASTATRYSSRADFSLPRDAFLLGALGRLHIGKNISFLLHCLKKKPNYNLVIAGDGPDREMLMGKVYDLSLTNRVHFLGMLSGEDITKFYKAIDLFLMPSLYEGFGRTLVEALHMGVPTICSNLDVLREVSNGAAICLPLAQTEWIKAFEQISNNSALREEMSKKGQERAKYFSSKSMLDGYLRAFM